MSVFRFACGGNFFGDHFGFGGKFGDAEVLFEEPEPVTGWPLVDTTVHFLQIVFYEFGRFFSWRFGALQIDEAGVEGFGHDGGVIDEGDVEIDVSGVEGVVDESACMHRFDDIKDGGQDV